MKNSFLFLIFIFAFIKINAQINQPCVDTLRINPYSPCYMGYDPVCGCDLIIYRNYCFAYSKFGVNDWQTGICNNQLFDIDLVPNPVQVEPAIFSMAVRVPSSCSIFITDVFSSIVYNRNVFTNFDNEIVSFEIDVTDFNNGVYLLIAVVQGQKKFIKFVRVKY